MKVEDEARGLRRELEDQPEGGPADELRVRQRQRIARAAQRAEGKLRKIRARVPVRSQRGGEVVEPSGEETRKYARVIANAELFQPYKVIRFDNPVGRAKSACVFRETGAIGGKAALQVLDPRARPCPDATVIVSMALDESAIINKRPNQLRPILENFALDKRGERQSPFAERLQQAGKRGETLDGSPSTGEAASIGLHIESQYDGVTRLVDRLSVLSGSLIPFHQLFFFLRSSRSPMTSASIPVPA